MPPRPDLHPDTAGTTDLMRRLQDRVADAAVFEGAPPAPVDEAIVAGVDQAFPHPGAVVSAAVAERGGTVLERVSVDRTPAIGYVPGLLAFREGPAAIAAVEALADAPAVVLVDGNGRIHPRQAGLATHLGVVLDRPTVGVAKSLLCGRPRGAIDGLDAGEAVAIDADDAIDADAETVVGYAVQTRQYAGDSRHINPLIVSPGHRVDAAAAVDIVLETAREHKLPAPLRRADRHAADVAGGAETKG